jgi:opacity protein-like surface antigen
MRSLKLLAIAGIIAVGAAGAASAADMPLPPAPAIPVAEPDYGGWYLRGDVGYGMGEISAEPSTFAPGFVVPGFAQESVSIGNAAIIGAGFGYQFNSWFRTDVTGEWRSEQKYRAYQSYSDAFGFGCANGRCGDAYSSNIQTSGLFMLNGYFDLGTWSSITPYVGAGIGTGYTRWGALTDVGTDPAAAGFGIAASRSEWRLAWSLMAGASVAISPSVSLDVGYRYLDLGKMDSAPILCGGAGACSNEVQRVALSSHDVRIGLRWMFGVPVAAYEPPAPIVRKY